jgi:hypothetical protein
MIWREQESSGILRNPQESSGILRNPQESSGIRSKYRNSCPPGIPAKNSCKIGKNRNYCDPLQNHVPVKNSSGNSGFFFQESSQERFFGSKK